MQPTLTSKPITANRYPELIAKGYRCISNKHGIVARIDTPYWIQLLESYGYRIGCGFPPHHLADKYIREYSEDKLMVESGRAFNLACKNNTSYVASVRDTRVGRREAAACLRRLDHFLASHQGGFTYKRIIEKECLNKNIGFPMPMSYEPKRCTNYTQKELVERGFRVTSRKHLLVNRIGRADWLENSRVTKILPCSRVEHGLPDFYRRSNSYVGSERDQITVPEHYICGPNKIPNSGWDQTGYIYLQGDKIPAVTMVREELKKRYEYLRKYQDGKIMEELCGWTAFLEAVLTKN